MKKKAKRVVAIDMSTEHKKFCDGVERNKLRDDIASAAMAAIIGKFPAIEVDHESAVAEAVKAAGVDLVIHGHTHKPAAHMQNGYERWVIPDWELDGPDGTAKSGAITFLEGARPQIQMF